MCLPIPAKIVSIDGDEAETEISGARRRVSIGTTPDARAADYVHKTTESRTTRRGCPAIILLLLRKLLVHLYGEVDENMIHRRIRSESDDFEPRPTGDPMGKHNLSVPLTTQLPTEFLALNRKHAIRARPDWGAEMNSAPTINSLEMPNSAPGVALAPARLLRR